MFEAGFLEMLVIGVIALLVVGPERLPKVAATVGRWVGKARSFITSTRADIEREFQTDQMREMLSTQEKEIRELRDMMQKQAGDVSHQVQESQQEAAKALKDTKNS